MPRLTPQAYTVAWLCALPRSELVAATAMLDEEHDSLSLPSHDDNSYTYGSINGHNVVIACMPPGQPGKVSASKLVQPLSQSFPNLKIHLFVGIGGGVPRIPPPANPEDDIHLGDVVIGWAENPGVPGVVQWDLVRHLEDGSVERLGILEKPDRRLLTALGLILANRIRRKTRFPEHLKRLPKSASFSHPGLEHDRLFKPTCHHVGGSGCSSCDHAQLSDRLPRENQDLIFHQGTIVSGDIIMQDAQQRDKISQIYHGAICFEMEAAGVMDDKRCLIIRGIADYADSHGNGSWQNYAAGTAAAFAREFLFTIQPQVVNGMDSAASPHSTPIGLTEDQKACLQSLSFSEMDFRKNDVVDPTDKTCRWLLKHRIYLRWLREHRGLLWLKGKPGAGKSTLMGYALKQQKVQDRLITASFFFHGRGALIQKSLLGIFRSLLFQILQHVPDLLSSYTKLFKTKCETQGKVGEKWIWQESELRKLVKEHIRDAIETYSVSVQIFVDALDECGEYIARELVDFFERLIDELPHTKASLRICFSCRHHPLVALKRGSEICIEDENGDDIELYTRQKLGNGIQNQSISAKLQADILQRSQNVFQWVVLVVHRIILLYRKGKSLLFIQKELHKIPTELDELYQELLQSIDDDEKTQTLQLMQWICFAFRPLSLQELRFAIAVDAQTPHDSLSKCQATEEYADTNEEMEKRINDLSKGLAEVTEFRDEQVVQFVHQSVSDYLIEKGLSMLTSKTVPNLNDVVGSAHLRLSRSCLKFLSMKEICDGRKAKDWNGRRTEDWELRQKYRFFEYANFNWLEHAKEVDKRQISQIDLLDFFSQPSLLNQILGEQTLLHIASKHSFYDVVSAILDTDDAELNSKDNFGQPPLFRAAENGNKRVVKLLLEQKNIAPNLGDHYNCTPLHIAADVGHAEVVKLLLAHPDTAPNLADNSNRTPLYAAAISGHVEVVELLLAHENTALNLADSSKRTPLHVAVILGHVEVVKLLLARKDIAPNLADRYKRTPLHIAADTGRAEVVELLLGHEDIAPNFADEYKRTPLRTAARYGHVKVVELLLRRTDIDPNLKDMLGGSTPLRTAARYGHVKVVELLLRRTDIDPNLIGMLGGSTPLHIAAASGQVEIVEMLLAHPDTAPNLADESKRTPLYMAATSGCVKVVELLLAQKNIAPNLVGDNYNCTPLHIAADVGHAEVVELLLTHKNIALNLGDQYKRTPLYKAVKYGHAEVVELLLAHPNTDPNLADNSNRTPLYVAASSDHVEVVEMLLAQKNIAPNLANEFKRTPLHIAADVGHVEVVELLLAHPDTAPNLADDSKRTPLYMAATSGRVKVVELLLAQKNIAPNLGDHYNCTPLHIAADVGHAEVVKLLLAQKDIAPNLADDYYQITPLYTAANYGHAEVVELLLGRADVDPNLTDVLGSSPLHIAAKYGHAEVVELLLAHTDIAPNLADNSERTSFLYVAASSGHVEVVKSLLARNDIEVQPENQSDDDPIRAAIQEGHEEVVELLRSALLSQQQQITTVHPLASQDLS